MENIQSILIKLIKEMNKTRYILLLLVIIKPPSLRISTKSPMILLHVGISATSSVYWKYRCIPFPLPENAVTVSKDSGCFSSFKNASHLSILSISTTKILFTFPVNKPIALLKAINGILFNL